ILRREAAACLGDWVGLDPVDLSETKPAFEGVLNTDGTVAAITRDDDRVSLRDTQTGRQLALLDVTGFAKDLRFDRKGSALSVSPAALAGGGQRPEAWHLEKWSTRAEGRWMHDWTRPSSGVTWVETTESGVVALSLTASTSHWTVVDLDRDRELG